LAQKGLKLNLQLSENLEYIIFLEAFEPVKNYLTTLSTARLHLLTKAKKNTEKESNSQKLPQKEVIP
jgi:hypothetical protein